MLEVVILLKAVLRSAITTSGVQSAMTHGVHLMPEWSVDSLDTHQQVWTPTITLANVKANMHLYFLAATAVSFATFGQGAGPIVLDDVRCTATENRLIDCPANFNHNCRHSEDAGVRCTSSTTGIKFFIHL